MNRQNRGDKQEMNIGVYVNNLSDLRYVLDEIEKHINELETQHTYHIKQLELEIDNLESECGELEDENNELKNELYTAEKKNAELQNKLDELKGEQ